MATLEQCGAVLIWLCFSRLPDVFAWATDTIAHTLRFDPRQNKRLLFDPNFEGPQMLIEMISGRLRPAAGETC
jgi:hypothetical protein